jgi:ATP-dependent DNA helicase PIF1
MPTDIPFEFKRLQFRVRLSFAMSINKVQRQTLQLCDLN